MSAAWWIWPVLFATGFGAGLVDSIAGGGGLISLPVLLALGVPPAFALGTNKLQGACGSFTASWNYVRRGVARLRDCRLGIACALAGGLLGAFAVQRLDARALNRVIPALLVLIVLYAIFRPRVGEQDHPPRLRRGAFYALFGLGFGFYDGFFGPGVGSFWAIAFVAVLGFNLAKATGYTKVMNCASNLAALALFALGGKILYAAGLVMAAGQVLGARLGSGLVVRRGARFVRPVFLAVVVLTLLKLLHDLHAHPAG